MGNAKSKFMKFEKTQNFNLYYNYTTNILEDLIYTIEN